MGHTIVVDGTDLAERFGPISHFAETLPEPKVIKVSIPAGLDLDITDSLGRVGYHDGEHRFDVWLLCETEAERVDLEREIVLLLHGKRLEYSLSWDEGYTYTGRFALSFDHPSMGATRVGVTVDRSPWKTHTREYVELNCHPSEAYVLSGSARFHTIRAKLLQPGTTKVGDGDPVTRASAGTYMLAGDAYAGTTVTITVDEWLLYVDENADMVVNPDKFSLDGPTSGTGTASGEAISVADAAALPPKSMTVSGVSVQDGTPTPSSPVPIVSVDALSIHAGADGAADADGWPRVIDLQGNELRGLPDGTCDELTVDEDGKVTLTKRVGSYTVTGSETSIQFAVLGTYSRLRITCLTDAPSETGSNGMYTDGPYTASWSSDSAHGYCGGKYAHLFTVGATQAEALASVVGASLTYKLTTPQTIDLGYVTLPDLPSPLMVMSAGTDPQASMALTYYAGLATFDAAIDADYTVSGGAMQFPDEAKQHVTMAFDRWDL